MKKRREKNPDSSAFEKEIEKDKKQINWLKHELSLTKKHIEREEDSKDLTESQMLNFKREIVLFQKLPIYGRIKEISSLTQKDFPRKELFGLLDSLFENFIDFIRCSCRDPLSEKDIYYIILHYAGIENKYLCHLFQLTQDSMRKKKSRLQSKFPERLSLELFKNNPSSSHF